MRSLSVFASDVLAECTVAGERVHAPSLQELAIRLLNVGVSSGLVAIVHVRGERGHRVATISDFAKGGDVPETLVFRSQRIQWAKDLGT